VPKDEAWEGLKLGISSLFNLYSQLVLSGSKWDLKEVVGGRGEDFEALHGD